MRLCYREEVRAHVLTAPPPDLVAFCEAQFPRLVGALGLYCGDRDVAEDLAQEALARACRDWRKVKELDSPEAWAHRVGMNLAHSHFRRRGAEKRAALRLTRSGLTGTDQQVTDRADLLDAVHRLPHRQRSAVILRYYLGFAIHEVASALECPEGTAKTLIHRGVAALRRRLEPIEGKGAPDAV